MNRILTVVVVAGGLLGTLSAHAATMTTATQTVTFGPGLTDFTNASQPLNLFNNNLGTLESVTISATYGFSSTLTITNTGNSASGGSVKTESAAAFGSSNTAINAIIQNLLDTNGSVTIGQETLNPTAFDFSGSSASYTLAAGHSTTAVSNATTHSIAPLTDSTAADLLAFEAAGGGIFNALFNTITGTDLSNSGGNTSAGQTTTATGTLSLYYTYATVPTPVPEPTSMALLGAGVLGAGMLRRSRK